jgi:hypothetical protein
MGQEIRRIKRKKEMKSNQQIIAVLDNFYRLINTSTK